MNSELLSRYSTRIFVFLFFAYLFGPLIIMSLSAFNSASFPRISPWECFTVEWFGVLINDSRLMEGLRNSVIIGIGVVCLSIPLGLAGALMLTQVSDRLRPWYYTIIISPILIPGVVLGISTLIFWDRLGAMFNAGYNSFFYDGIFLTIIGQSTFVSAYAMLIFISRLERFDPAQEEAALDLGATHVQTFTKVLLPFLKPAVGSAAVLAFLASFENYNTTVFTIVSESTLTTVLASKVRYGINPSISSLAVIIIALTLIAAVYYEILKRREVKYEKEAQRIAFENSTDRAERASLLANPAIIIATVVFIAGLGTIYMAGTRGVAECKADVKEQKRLIRQQKIEERRALIEKQRKLREQQKPATTVKPSQPRNEGFGGMFKPGNLSAPAEEEQGEQTPSEPESKSESPQNSSFGGMFSKDNLNTTVGSGSDEQSGDSDEGNTSNPPGKDDQ